MDPQESATLSQALDDVMARTFSSSLGAGERRFLRNLTNRLIDEGSSVQEVLQNFGRSLKSFVQSKEYLEQRRFNALLKGAQREALIAKDLVRANQAIGYELTLTSSKLRSCSQWRLYDPAERVVDSSMNEAAPSTISLDAVAELVRQSEIDFKTLRQNIHQLLQTRDQVRIDEVLQAFPAKQGLGSVVGYLSLGARHGQVTPLPVRVSWVGADKVHRHAHVPSVYFLKEHEHEFV